MFYDGKVQNQAIFLLPHSFLNWEGGGWGRGGYVRLSCGFDKYLDDSQRRKILVIPSTVINRSFLPSRSPTYICGHPPHFSGISPAIFDKYFCRKVELFQLVFRTTDRDRIAFIVQFIKKRYFGIYLVEVLPLLLLEFLNPVMVMIFLFTKFSVSHERTQTSEECHLSIKQDQVVNSSGSVHNN